MSLPVTIIIPTWNSAECIQACLDKAHLQNVQSIHVIDNGSVDNTLNIVRTEFPDVQITSWPENRGFARAMNFGISECNTPFVFLLNDDCELESGHIDILLQTLQNSPQSASATGKLLGIDRDNPTIDSVGIRLDKYALRPMDEGLGQIDVGQFDQNRTISGPSAAAVLFRVSALNSLGAPPFDESLVSYYEDVDLAWRLTNAQWSHQYCYRAVGFHQRRGPSNKPNHIRARAFANRYIVWAKNESLKPFLLYGAIAIPWEIMRIGRRALTQPQELTQIPPSLVRSISHITKRLVSRP